MIHLLAPKPQKNHIDRSSIVMVAKYPKLYRYSKRIFSSNNIMLMLRAGFETKSDCRFFGGCRHFPTLVRTNSAPTPHRRSKLSSGRPFKSSIVGNLPFTRLRRYFSLRLWPSWRSRSAGDMCRKSIFVSSRNERLRMTTHWPRRIHREDVLRRAWWLHIILAVIFMHEFPSCVEFWDGWDFFLGEPNIYAPKCCAVLP